MTEEVPIRVLLLDDHEVVRSGLREMLESTGEFTVVGEAGTAAQALARIPLARADVAVLDVRLPDGNGIEVCREMTSALPDLQCLMLTSFSDDQALLDSILAGAAGYVLKQIRGTEIIDSIRQISQGRPMLDAQAKARVLERVTEQQSHDTELEQLTAQERRILELIGEGMTNRQIGEAMFLAEKTVKNYVSNILRKLGLHRRTEAAALIVRADERRRRMYEDE